MFKSTYMGELTEDLDGWYEYTCGVPVKIKFDKNEMYEVSYQHTGLTCSAEVSRIYNTPEGDINRESLKVFTNKVYGFGKHCKEAFDREKLY
ncbi:hypothetical protein GCE9029_02850 [Grimontia celer]|uniref:Uncharacterized protein n=1 Tax=Grimontia celer TaxID=1796497 RepID=A0A128F4V1_9GAMM|nr:hypothetical protein [Grimontia celer]CZF81823.1 hypothetical protein GCE9029_02850 [Grimontia celer]